jgi:hypothetical protein
MDEEVELARLWMQGDEFQSRLRPNLLPPEVWGEALADVAANVASSLAKGDEAERLKLLAAIRAAFTETLQERAKEG